MLFNKWKDYVYCCKLWRRIIWKRVKHLFHYASEIKVFLLSLNDILSTKTGRITRTWQRKMEAESPSIYNASVNKPWNRYINQMFSDQHAWRCWRIDTAKNWSEQSGNSTQASVRKRTIFPTVSNPSLLYKAACPSSAAVHGKATVRGKWAVTPLLWGHDH